MKRWMLLVVAGLTVPRLWGEDIDKSTAAPSVAVTGETIMAPPPEAMTDSSRQDVFVTLTRTAYSAQELPTSAEIVTPESIRRLGAQNLGEAVARQTSVQTFPTGRLGSFLAARLRGSSANQTQVLIDGRPAAGLFIGTPDLSEIPLEQIDRIEIVRGGVSAPYGPPAIGGVINVITQRATHRGLPISHLSFVNRSYSAKTLRLDFASRRGRVDYFFFGNRQWESGFRDNSDARTFNIGGNVGVSMGAAGKVLMDVASYHRNAGVPGLRCDTSDPSCQSTRVLQPNRFNDKDEKVSSSPNARQDTDTSYVRTSYIVGLPADSLLTLRWFGTQRNVDYKDPANPNIVLAAHTESREQSKGGEAQLDLPLGLLVGGSFIRDRKDVTHFLAPSDSFIKAVENWGFFAQETLRWRRWTLIPSGRYDQNSQFGDTMNPRAQLLMNATDWLRFSGSASRSFRAPTIDDMTPVPSLNYVGHSSLRPEKAWTYDAGFELHESSRSLQITYFRVQITDLIQTFIQADPSDPLSPFMAANLSRAKRQGVEVRVDQTVNPFLSYGVNYTYLENLAVLPGGQAYAALAYSPRHTVNYFLTLHPVARASIESTWRYVGSRYNGNDRTGSKMGSYLTWDLRFAYEVRQIELYIGAHNLANKRYVEQPGFPLPGRNYFGGFTLRLWG